MNKRFLLMALMASAISAPVMALEAGSMTLPEGSPQAATAANVLTECETNAACDCDIAADLVEANLARQNADIADMVATGGRPTKTTEMDCFSTLSNISLYASLPSLKDLAGSIYDQAVDAACNVAVSKSRELMGNVGLDFNQNLGGNFVIPGTNESINVNGGSAGVDTGFNASNGDGNTGYSVRDNVSVSEDSGVDVNVGVQGGGSSSDAYERLKNIF